VKRVGLDARRGRAISVGMRTYVDELTARLPQIAPQFSYRVYAHGENLSPLEQITLPLRMRYDGIDLAHYLSQYVPLLAGGAYVVTIHDLIAMRFPEYHRKRLQPYYRTVVRRACRNAARIITDDVRTVDDLVNFLDADAGKIRVIPLAPRATFVAQAQPRHADRPYIMNVGNHRQHKSVDTLLHAWSQLPARYEVDLYLTGPDDFGGALQRVTNDHRRAVALGDVDDAALASYYAGALALVHPALLEGFGLPLVEAMTQGCPVIATTTSLPQPIQGCALTFEPGDADGARAQIERVLDDQALRTGLVERGRTAVAALSWDRTARETAAVYREVFGEAAHS
jgi:glycosyltransferase involved in cell wall biosynthesis